MDYKKFCKIFVSLLLGSIVLCVIVSVYVDPYNVLHWDNVRSNGIEPNRNYIKTHYIANNPLKYDAFLFGSSRVGAIHVEKMTEMPTYNMAYSLGIPAEHLANIKTFLGNGVRIKRIYIGIDNILLTIGEQEHRTPIQCSYEYLVDNPGSFCTIYLFNPSMIVASLKYYKKNIYSEDIEQIYRHGWWFGYDVMSQIDFSNVNLVKRCKSSKGKFFEGALSNLVEIKKLCDNNKIELVVFTNPTYEKTYISGLNTGYVEFLQELVKITNFYNFSGINDVTSNGMNYIDTSHYKAYVGDMIIDVLCNKKRFDSLYQQGFGWYVTRDNIDALIKLIDIPVEN